jgi:hypothetical protein
MGTMNGPPQLRIYPTLVPAAVACVLGVLLIKGVPLALKDMGVARTTVLVWTLGWPFQKQPPSPAYLGVYIGLGLLLLGGLLAADARPALHRWLTIPAALGRASLAVFIAQYFFYFTVLYCGILLRPERRLQRRLPVARGHRPLARRFSPLVVLSIGLGGAPGPRASP